MANPNPTKARRARSEQKRERLTHILAHVSNALERSSDLLEHDDPNIALRAANAIFQGAVAYARVYEVGELESRLEALEHLNMEQ